MVKKNCCQNIVDQKKFGQENFQLKKIPYRKKMSVKNKFGSKISVDKKFQSKKSSVKKNFDQKIFDQKIFGKKVLVKKNSAKKFSKKQFGPKKILVSVGQQRLNHHG